MGRKIIRIRKVYTVDCYRNGFCYCTHTECSWEDVKNLRRIAKLLGETIQYSVDRIIKEDYS